MDFFKDLASSIYEGDDGAQIALIRSAGYVTTSQTRVMFNLTAYITSNSIISALDDITFSFPFKISSHFYNFAYAVKLALDDVFPYKRPDSQSVIIAVTADLLSAYPYWSLISDVPAETQMNETMLLVAGLDVAVDTLVDNPEHGFQLTNSSQLQSIVPRILDILCPGKY